MTDGDDEFTLNTCLSLSSQPDLPTSGIYHFPVKSIQKTFNVFSFYLSESGWNIYSTDENNKMDTRNIFVSRIYMIV